MNRATGMITKIRVNGYVNSFVHNSSPPRSRHAGNGRLSTISGKNGDPYGNRTRVSAVKGPRPNR